MMARFRKQALRPVNRIKHVFDASATVPSNTPLNQVIVRAVDAPTTAVTNSVAVGSTVNGIYIKVECSANEMIPNGIANVYLFMAKNPGANLTFPNANAVGESDNKKFVFHQEMIMLQNEDGGNPRILFNGVIVIPKHLRRMAPNDEIFIQVFSPVFNITYCTQSHYKEFR